MWSSLRRRPPRRDPSPRQATASGVEATNTTTAVRFAPGRRTARSRHPARGADVQIDGRTTDADWLRIVFPELGVCTAGWTPKTSISPVTPRPRRGDRRTADTSSISRRKRRPRFTPDDAETTLGTGRPNGTVTPDGLQTRSSGSRRRSPVASSSCDRQPGFRRHDRRPRRRDIQLRWPAWWRHDCTRLHVAAGLSITSARGTSHTDQTVTLVVDQKGASKREHNLIQPRHHRHRRRRSRADDTSVTETPPTEP